MPAFFPCAAICRSETPHSRAGKARCVKRFRANASAYFITIINIIVDNSRCSRERSIFCRLFLKKRVMLTGKKCSPACPAGVAIDRGGRCGTFRPVKRNMFSPLKITLSRPVWRTCSAKMPRRRPCAERRHDPQRFEARKQRSGKIRPENRARKPAHSARGTHRLPGRGRAFGLMREYRNVDTVTTQRNINLKPHGPNGRRVYHHT